MSRHFEQVLGTTHIIDDSNFTNQVSLIANGECGGGYKQRDYSSSPFTTTMSLPIIRDRKVLVEMAEERQAKGATLAHLFDFYKIPILNQNGLPFCWNYGATGAEMMCYAVQGGVIPILSATSSAALITNFQERGGWAKEALVHKAVHGTAVMGFWPEHDLNRKHNTPQMRDNAKLHIPTDYDELPKKDFLALCNYLLAGIPVTLGLLWWGHLVYGLRVVVLQNGELAIEIVNSWGPRWESNGRAILVESKATADEQIAIRRVSPLVVPDGVQVEGNYLNTAA